MNETPDTSPVPTMDDAKIAFQKIDTQTYQIKYEDSQRLMSEWQTKYGTPLGLKHEFCCGRPYVVDTDGEILEW